MTEILFILTIIYVAYVVYMVVGDKKPVTQSAPKNESVLPKVSQPIGDSSSEPSVVADVQPMAPVIEAKAPDAVKIENVAAEVVIGAEKVAITQQAEPKTNAGKAASAPRKPAASKAPAEVRNPETGEINALPNNYRFAKRWMKEAMVKEGLLPKVYKSDELDEKTNKKIKTAFTKLGKLEQYRV